MKVVTDLKNKVINLNGKEDELSEWVFSYLIMNNDVVKPENIVDRINALELALEQNPNLLLDIPCEQLKYWKEVANHQIPQSVKTRIQNVDNQTGIFESASLQSVYTGGGPSLNMDLFQVKISTMPNKPNSTQKYTPAEFFEFFRKNINLFAEKFTPIEDDYYNIHDTALWNSANPLGALIHIDIAPDDGTVVCSGVSNNTWIFTTMKAPQSWSYDGVHPVAGNRAFSYYTNPDGSINIYTRGVDRTSKINDEDTPIINYAMETIAFAGADDLWKNMQEKLKKHVIDNGGNASIIEPIKYRPNYNGIRNYLKGKTPLSSLGCK